MDTTNLNNAKKIAWVWAGVAVIAVLGIIGLFVSGESEPEKQFLKQEFSVDCSRELAPFLGNVSYICSDPVATKAFLALVNEVESLAINQTEKKDIIKSQQSTLERLVENKIRSPQPEKYNLALGDLAMGDPSQVDELIDELIDEVVADFGGKSVIAAVLYWEKGALWFAGDTEKSLKAYQRSTELDDNNRAGWNLLGLLYQRKGEFGAAESAYGKLLDLADSDPEYQTFAYMNLGKMHQLQGDLGQAISSYEKALATAVNFGYKEGEANAYVSLGLVHEIQGTLDQAITNYKKGLTINVEMDNKKTMANIYNNLGLVYQTRGQFDQAVICYQKALTISKSIGDKEGEVSVSANLEDVQETLEWVNESAPTQLSTLE